MVSDKPLFADAALYRLSTPEHVVSVVPSSCYDCGGHHGEQELTCSCGYYFHLGHAKNAVDVEISHRLAVMRGKP